MTFEQDDLMEKDVQLYSTRNGSNRALLSDRIREARRLSDMTRSDLARHIGVRASAAAQWEYKDGTAPTVQNLIKIASVTKVSFEWLAMGRGSPRVLSTNEVPAVRLADFAENIFEEQMLLFARQMPLNLRQPLAEFFRALLRTKT